MSIIKLASLYEESCNLIANAIVIANKIDLTNLEDYSYSAVTREFRKTCNKEEIKLFLSLFKKHFDKAVLKKLQKPEKVALQNSLIEFNKTYPIKINKLVKNAAISELGDPKILGKYLADIVKITVHRISPEQRPKSIQSLKYKISILNANEIGSKKMPPSSSMGQSLTFIKHILFSHDPQYIREVLNNIVRNL